MGEKCKLVLVGDKWPAQEKLADNLIIPEVDKGAPLEASADAIMEKLGLKDLKDLEIFKGKGKPPQVLPGKQVQLKQTPTEIGDKAGLVVLYFRRTPIRIMLCGTEWPAKEKLSENISVKVRRNEKISAKTSSLANKLGIDGLGGISFCQGVGKPPDVQPGAPVDIDKTPDELGFNQVAAMLYVRQEEPAPIIRTPEMDDERAKGCLEKRTVVLTDGPLGLDFRASCGRVFVIKVVDDSPMQKAGIPAFCCVHTMDGNPVKTKDEVIQAVQGIRAAGKTEFEVEIDCSHVAPFYYGSRVDCRLLYEDGSDEWAPGYICCAYEGDYFDVQLLEEDEVERYVPHTDLKPTLGQAPEGEEPQVTAPKQAEVGAPAKLPPKGREPDHEGDMQKKGETGGYKPRRMVLFNGRDGEAPGLYYYAPKKSQPQGVLDLRDAVYEDRYATGEKASKSKFSIAGKHIQRVVLLDAYTEDDKLAWFSALEKAGVAKTAASKDGS
eukprot:TRINITY_DN64950_c0_g1_i1.p1 TRINITY_DN64950_c0_g1~~TRINITY_DN64950_c0_g1_i1.p1  ORF type:complete len:520 (+),score=187.69 TRINITY_DN64950_c0_g1_i1:83-1561(+)